MTTDYLSGRIDLNFLRRVIEMEAIESKDNLSDVFDVDKIKSFKSYISSAIYECGRDVIQLFKIIEGNKVISFAYGNIDPGRMFLVYVKDGESSKGITSGNFKYGWIYEVDGSLVVSEEWKPHVDAKAITFIVKDKVV